MPATDPARPRRNVRRLSPRFAVAALVTFAMLTIAAPLVARRLAAGREAAPAAVTISHDGGPEGPLETRGLTGRVVGDDGVLVQFDAGGTVYTLHHLSADRFQHLLAHRGEVQHIAPTPSGRLMISEGSAAAE